MAHGDALKKVEQVLPEAFKGAAPAPVFEFSRRFSFSQPERDHSIGDTIKFAQSLAAKTWSDPDQQRQAILKYITAFAQTSKVMQTLDEACPPIMRTVREQTYPNAIVDLARTIPKDKDGGTKTRVDFISEHLGRSKTFLSHISQHGYETLPSALVNSANAVWAVHRAFRSLDDTGRTALVFALGPKLPKHGHLILANMHADFTPFMSTAAAKPEMR